MIIFYNYCSFDLDEISVALNKFSDSKITIITETEVSDSERRNLFMEFSWNIFKSEFMKRSFSIIFHYVPFLIDWRRFLADFKQPQLREKIRSNIFKPLFILTAYSRIKSLTYNETHMLDVIRKLEAEFIFWGRNQGMMITS